MTLMAGPIYTLISVKVPVWVRKAMEKIMKAFQWTSSNTVQGGKCLVAKPKVLRSLRLGGLGMLDLHSMGIALQVHWLWLQHVDPDHPWLTMPADEDMVTRVFFQTSM
jgi:hypothetical protein